jgi:hypothetical protein
VRLLQALLHYRFLIPFSSSYHASKALVTATNPAGLFGVQVAVRVARTYQNTLVITLA